MACQSGPEIIDEMNRYWIAEYLAVAQRGNIDTFIEEARKGLPGLAVTLHPCHELIEKLREFSRREMTVARFWTWYDAFIEQTPECCVIAVQFTDRFLSMAPGCKKHFI